MTHYYNEIDPGAAAWLQNLIAVGLIPPGEVDQRSITDVQAKDLEGFDSCHFFAGIAGWPLALRLAGWPDDRPVWTGSCPCQSYSVAGKRKGDDDPRNLWPHFFRLISERRPDCIFGEQVANAIRHGWLDGISADLEGAGYAVGACVLGAHSAGAPHIRQRLFWVADSTGRRLGIDGVARGCERHADECSSVMDNAECPDAGLRDGQERPTEGGGHRLAITSPVSALGDTKRHGLRAGRRKAADEPDKPIAGAWSSYWIAHCRDGKSRRVGTGLQPLAHRVPRSVGLLLSWLESLRIDPSGLDRKMLAEVLRLARSNRVTRLRAYGNSITIFVASEFIKAAMESLK